MPRSKWKVEIYESPDHKFRWRLKSNNGCIVADGSEGYYCRSNAHRAVKEVKRRIYCAPIEDITGRTP